MRKEDASQVRMVAIYGDNNADQCGYADNAYKNRHSKVCTAWKLLVIYIEILSLYFGTSL